MDIIALANFGPNDDAKTWAFRLVHYGLIIGAIGFIVLIAILAMVGFIAVRVVRVSRDLRRLSNHIKGFEPGDT